MFSFLRKLFDRDSTALRPEQLYSDDMSVPLPPGKTPDDVVDFFEILNERGDEPDRAIKQIQAEFELTQEQAEHVLDRIGGGLTRAMLNPNLGNAPHPKKDPIAHAVWRRKRAQAQ